MIVVDSSAWIDFFRGSGSDVHRAVRRLLSEEAELAVTEVVVMEVLADAHSGRDVDRIRERLVAFPVLPLRGLAGFEAAASLYRACRRGGESIRKLTDCLVAVPAIEADATILAADRDFEVLARHTSLRLEPVGVH